MRNKYRIVRGADETMVDSCPEDPSTSCCGPHVFTSVLLGVLACVLMTGGVFLAFHRWDPLWLIVSGVGVILVLIGSILHCCRGARPSAGKGCCLPDHHLHNHVLLNGGSLTEQLLPLSNARSVSQLSLNMLPGYFPPMVTTYGIEQHSAVVQNINRIIQQQSSQNPPQVGGSAGKNFILLSLPGNTPQANIQNLVATVYQLDGSVVAETTNSTEDPATTPSVSTAAASSSVQSNIPVLKNAQVQTCAAWPVPNAAEPITNASPSTSTAINERCCSPISTQTDVDVAINLMDCLPDPICDTSCNSASNEVASPAILVDISEIRTLVTEPEVNRTSLTDIPDSPVGSLSEINSIAQLPTDDPPEVLVDITEIVVDTSPSSNCLCSVRTPTELAAENASNSHTNEDSTTSITDIVTPPTSDGTLLVFNATDLLNSNSVIDSSRLDILEDILQNDHSESSSLSLVDADSIGRSSPPPSYEDVALQGENPAGVFGLAYGTL